MVVIDFSKAYRQRVRQRCRVCVQPFRLNGGVVRAPEHSYLAVIIDASVGIVSTLFRRVATLWASFHTLPSVANIFVMLSIAWKAMERALAG